MGLYIQGLLLSLSSKCGFVGVMNRQRDEWVGRKRIDLWNDGEMQEHLKVCECLCVCVHKYLAAHICNLSVCFSTCGTVG